MAALPIIAAAASAIGTVVSVFGAISQGQQAADAARYDAQVAERNAVIARQQAAADAQAQQRDARRRIGAARAAYGSAGVDLEGSPLDALEESAANAELDRQNILYRGRLREIGYTDQAASSRVAGSQAESAGYMRAGSALLSGGARTASMIEPLLTRS